MIASCRYSKLEEVIADFNLKCQIQLSRCILFRLLGVSNHLNKLLGTEQRVCTRTFRDRRSGERCRRLTLATITFLWHLSNIRKETTRLLIDHSVSPFPLGPAHLGSGKVRPGIRAPDSPVLFYPQIDNLGYVSRTGQVGWDGGKGAGTGGRDMVLGRGTGCWHGGQEAGTGDGRLGRGTERMNPSSPIPVERGKAELLYVSNHRMQH